MKRRLCNTEKITYHYQSVSETEKNKYYEAYAVQGKSDEKTFTIFLGYRSIDSILYKEKATQKRLEKALEEAEPFTGKRQLRNMQMETVFTTVNLQKG